MTDPWDKVLAGASAQGVRGFRKSSDQSCMLDAPLISHHTSLDAAAAQESVTRGKQPQPCPVFYVPPGLPPPSPRLPLPVHSVPGARQRFHAELLPQEGHLQGAQGPDVPQSKVAMHKEGGNGICSFRASLPAQQGRCQPRPALQTLAAGVFRSPSQRACARQSVPHFYTCRKKRRKLAS